MSTEELLSWFTAGLFALAIGLPMFKSYFRFGSEDEDVENCGIPENLELIWQNSLESQRLTTKWMDISKRDKVTVTSNRCNYCGTKNEQNYGTCCKCGAPL